MEKEDVAAKGVSNIIVAKILLRFLFSRASIALLSIDERDAVIMQLNQFVDSIAADQKEDLPQKHIKNQSVDEEYWRHDNHFVARRLGNELKIIKASSANSLEYYQSLSGITSFLYSKSPRSIDLSSNFFERIDTQNLFGERPEEFESREAEPGAIESDRSLHAVEPDARDKLAIHLIEARLRKKVFGCFIRASDIVGDPQPDLPGAHEAQETFRRQVLGMIEYCSLHAIEGASVLFTRLSLDGFGFAFELKKEAGHLRGLGHRILELPTSIKRCLDELPLHRERERLANRRSFNRIMLALDWHYTDEEEAVHCAPISISKGLTRGEYMCEGTKVLLTGRAHDAGTSAGLEPHNTTLWFATEFEPLLSSREILYKPKDEG